MTKRSLVPYEWWPVILLEQPDEHNYQVHDIPDDLLARYRAALAEWVATQQELARIGGVECATPAWKAKEWLEIEPPK